MAIAISQGPNPGNVRLKKIVYDDITVLIDVKTCPVKAKIIRIRAPPHRQQYMRTNHRGLACLAFRLYTYPIFIAGKGDTLGIEPDLNPFGLKYFKQRRRYILVLMLD